MRRVERGRETRCASGRMGEAAVKVTLVEAQLVRSDLGIRGRHSLCKLLHDDTAATSRRLWCTKRVLRFADSTPDRWDLQDRERSALHH